MPTQIHILFAIYIKNYSIKDIKSYLEKTSSIPMHDLELRDTLSWLLKHQEITINTTKKGIIHHITKAGVSRLTECFHINMSIFKDAFPNELKNYTSQPPST